MWSFTRPGETVLTAQCPIDLRAVTSSTNAPMRVSVREAGRGAVAVWLADGDGMRWTRGCATGTLGKFECGSIRRGYGGEWQDEVSTWNFLASGLFRSIFSLTTSAVIVRRAGALTSILPAKQPNRPRWRSAQGLFAGRDRRANP